jgi:hypothetical protein
MLLQCRSNYKSACGLGRREEEEEEEEEEVAM